MKHSLDVEIATEYGVAEALILNSICYWTSYHAANGTNYFDGRFWVYNSYKAWTALFPYYSEKQIRRALDSLVEKEILAKGNYNKRKFDKTLWYALTDKGLELTKDEVSICQKVSIDLPYRADGLPYRADGCAPEDRPIPIINTNINTNNNVVVCSNNKLDSMDDNNNDFSPAKAWEDIIGLTVSRYIAEQLEELYQEVGRMPLEKAMKKAASRDKRNMAYISSVARGIASGNDFDEKKQEEPAQQESSLSPEQRKIYDRLVAEMKARKNGN